MNDVPSAAALLDAKSILATWDASFAPIDRLAAELVAICTANPSRRKAVGWTERDLLTESTFQKLRFNRDILRAVP